MKYQHSGIEINKNNYKYVKEYKKELFKNIVSVLNNNNIRYVIGHGNLIEYERKRPIIQDDDIDIRYNVRDIVRYIKYCKSLKNNVDIENNLVFDDRLTNFKQQLNNGIQVRLHKFDSNIEYTGDIHCDLVPNKLINQNFWIDYNVFCKPLRKIKYYGTESYAPSKELTKYYLEKEYGKNYMHPIVDYSKIKW